MISTTGRRNRISVEGNLQSLASSNSCKTTTKNRTRQKSWSKCQSIPRTVPRSPWKRKRSDATLEYYVVDRYQFCGPANRPIFEASEKGFVHISGLPSAGGKNLLSILDTPGSTHQENTNSTFQVDPPNMATFHGNCNSLCNLDDPW